METRTETRGRPITNHSHGARAKRDQYRTLRSVQLCAWSVSCGQNAILGSPYCDGHKAAVNGANAKLYETRRANDLCQNCGAQVVGRVRCWVCSQRRKGYASRQPEYRKMKERKT